MESKEIIKKGDIGHYVNIEESVFGADGFYLEKDWSIEERIELADEEDDNTDSIEDNNA